jgi:hypothetical protein
MLSWFRRRGERAARFPFLAAVDVTDPRVTALLIGFPTR